MDLPQSLREALDKELSAPAARGLHSASDELSTRYRKPSRDTTFMTSPAHRFAYLAARMPATYAAVSAVLSEWRRRQPGIEIETMLDMGSGPATAFWAASEQFPGLKAATLVEQDGDLITIGRRLLEGSGTAATTWLQRPMQKTEDINPHDLVIFSYSINELPDSERLPLVERAWNLARKALIIVEPGTPAGFERIRAIRSWLVGAGAHLAAPCPNALACPMAGTDWCHFAVRLERSASHRQAKGASMGYEDEKFSYIVAVKAPAELPSGRIVRHPQKKTGHLILTLCTEGELINKTISKRDGDIYKQARKLEWGDAV